MPQPGSLFTADVAIAVLVLFGLALRLRHFIVRSLNSSPPPVVARRARGGERGPRLPRRPALARITPAVAAAGITCAFLAAVALTDQAGPAAADVLSQSTTASPSPSPNATRTLTITPTPRPASPTATATTPVLRTPTVLPASATPPLAVTVGTPQPAPGGPTFDISAYVGACDGPAGPARCGVDTTSPAAVAAVAALPPPRAVPAGVGALAATTHVVNTTSDASDTDTTDGVCDIDSATSGNQCTLRAALEQSNANAGLDTIAFAIPGPGVHTIRPASALPIIVDPVIIDGTTQGPGLSAPFIELSGEATAGAGLWIAAGSSTVRGLTINRFRSSAIVLVGSGGNIVVGNYLGTDAIGRVAASNDGNGVYISSSHNRIGGTTPAERNVISGNRLAGVVISDFFSAADFNQIRGNYIGTDSSGRERLGNLNGGVAILAGVSNEVGGTEGVSADMCTGACNVIGNTGQNLGLSTAAFNLSVTGPAAGASVQGNYIGTDVTGTANHGNTHFANVLIGPASDGNLFGVGDSRARNLVANGASHGIEIRRSSGNVIANNYIGTDVTGTERRGNAGAGVFVNGTSGDARENEIGLPGQRNVISANGDGVAIQGARATGNVVQANLIGTRADGAGELRNLRHGIHTRAEASNNTIGNVDAGFGNRIAFNGGNGVAVESGTRNAVRGNLIHSNVGLSIDLGNDGATPNDLLFDADEGANGLQNFPELTSVSRLAIVQGRLRSRPNTTFRIEYFKASGGCGSSLRGGG